MSDSTRNDTSPIDNLPTRHPSVSQLWRRAREEGGSVGEQEDRYRELLEEFGHRQIDTMKW